MRLIDGEALRRLLPMAAAIDALEAGFRDHDPSGTPPRSHVETASGSLLLMPAAGPMGVGVKLVTLTPENPERGAPFIHALYALFDPRGQAPEVVIDGAALTALRTAAVSGLATRHAGRADARTLVVFGSGVQARSHIEAMRAVRPIEEVVIVSRTRGHAERLAEETRDAGVKADAGDPSVVRRADIVCTCTTSPEPVIRFADVPAGVHINAVGAYQTSARELDTETVASSRVIVETREAAAAEAGDLVIPIQEGVIGPDHVVADLRELVSGSQVRTSGDDRTLFKSVGIAFEDLIVARAAVDAR